MIVVIVNKQIMAAKLESDIPASPQANPEATRLMPVDPLLAYLSKQCNGCNPIS